MLTAKEASHSGVAPMRESSVKAYIGASTLILFCSFSPLLLAAPRFMHALGIPLSVVLMLLSAAYSVYAQVILAEAAYHMVSSSLLDLLSRVLRPWAYHFAAVSTMLTYIPAPEILALVDQTLGVYAQLSQLTQKVDSLVYVLIKLLYCIVVVLPFTLLPRGTLHGLTIGCAVAGFLFIVVFLCVCIVYGDWHGTGYIRSYRHDSPPAPLVPFEFHVKPGIFSPFYYVYCLWISPTLVGQQNKQQGSYSSRYRWAASTTFLTVGVILVLSFGISIVSVFFFDGTCTAVDTDCILLRGNYIMSLIYRDPFSKEYIMPFGVLVIVILYTASLVLVAVVKVIVLGNMLIPYISKIIRRKSDNPTVTQENAWLVSLHKLAGYSPKLPVGRTLSEPELARLHAQGSKEKSSVPCKTRLLYLLISGPIVCFTLALTLIIPDLTIISSLTATVVGSIVCVFVPLVIRYKLPYLRRMSAGRNIDLCAIAARYRENNISDGESSDSSALLDFYSSETSSSSSSSCSGTTTLSKCDSIPDRERQGLRKSAASKSLRSITLYSKAAEPGTRREPRKGAAVERDILAVTKRNRGSRTSVHREITEDDLESIQPCNREASISQLDTFKSVTSRMKERKMLIDDAFSGVDGSVELGYETIAKDVVLTGPQNSEKVSLEHTQYAVGIVIMGTLPDFSHVKIIASRTKKIAFLILMTVSLGLAVISLIFQFVILF
ncbi:Hypothetical protein GLP15_430 [Giardia lamblia P15]|uniref:Amino acid transporter n=1 Tax=Giardia intestinalis (strain P15) TaxID=658858 RepID=E1F067_GIAIA|nr:Hypothetical protein GLP15_430 [Giardia lamblia P15]